MLLPNTVGYAYLIVTAGLGIVALVFANKFLLGSPKRRPVKIGGGVALGLAAVGGVAYLAMFTAVVRVVHEGPAVAMHKYFMIGSTSVPIDGKAVELEAHNSGTVIVNETSDLVVSVDVRTYGASSSGSPTGVSVGPNAVGYYSASITNYGPDDPLPSSVSSKSSSAVRSWLNWRSVQSFLPPY
ncbi:MAG: hypothetical protein NT062_11570 [Proteobacteria bacterium]|nr:hypothetical protein [Pseudomonadota bacterium]